MNKLQVLLAAGDPFELNFDANWLGFGERASKGAYLDITEMLPAEAPAFYGQLTHGDIAAVSLNGVTYGVPWVFPKTDRRCFIIRDDLRVKHNVPEPYDLETFELYLKAVKENEPDIMPFLPASGFADTLFTIFSLVRLDLNLGLYVRLGDSDLELIALEQEPEFREIVEIANRWYAAGYLPQDILAATQQSSYNIEAGNLASRIHVNGLADGDATSKLQSVVPTGVQRTYVGYPDMEVALVPPSNNMLAMNANAEHPEAALRFLNWLHGDQENYDLFMWGIEGEHWELTDGRVHYLPNADEARYRGWPTPWPFWNIGLLRPTETEEPDKYEKVIEYVSLNTVDNPLAGFVPDYAPVKTEVAQRNALYQEVGIGFDYGLTDAGELSGYVRQQKPHTDVILAELQRQLDAWRATQE